MPHKQVSPLVIRPETRLRVVFRVAKGFSSGFFSIHIPGFHVQDGTGGEREKRNPSNDDSDVNIQAKISIICIARRYRSLLLLHTFVGTTLSSRYLFTSYCTFIKFAYPDFELGRNICFANDHHRRETDNFLRR